MMENHRSGLIWDLFMNAAEVSRGLIKLGFHTDRYRETDDLLASR